MMTDQSQAQTASGMGGKKPTKPGEFDSGDDKAKLPPLGGKDVILSKEDRDKIKDAWVQHMVKGMQQNQKMFNRTLSAFIVPYWLTVAMYIALFVTGLGLFIMAVVLGWRTVDPSNNEVMTIAVFGGLSAVSFIVFFIRQPLFALEENLEFISWLGVIYNTYWARLLYMNDMKTIQEDLQDASDDYSTTIERLIDKHGDLRGKRPGGDLTEPEEEPEEEPEDKPDPTTDDESLEGETVEEGADETKPAVDEPSEAETTENDSADGAASAEAPTVDVVETDDKSTGG
jgi:hypothetical protein